jgi:tripartite-type tricarboxylate transporter receptor subunit TctC
MTCSFTRRAFASLIAIVGALGAAAAVQAQTPWKPDKQVTIVVPYSPGGGTDAQSRAVARELQKIWGQTVIVDNTAGADGLIGTRKVIEAKPDGYTLLVQLNSLTLLKHLPTFKGTDPVTQLTPVSAFASLPGVFVASAKLPVKTVAEATRHCKAQPCSFGTTENVARLQAQMYKAETGIDNLVVVNYKGGGQLITDLVANNVNVAIMGITAALPHYKSGALRILASAGKKRSPVLPDVPSAEEAGMPAMDEPVWYGIFAPKDTPANIVQGVAAAVREAVKAEDVKKTFAVLGSDAIGNTPAEFAAMVKAEGDRMGALVKRFPIE